MAKGRRATETPAAWPRWMAVLIGLIVVAGIVWWVARPSANEAADASADIEGEGPRPLDVEGGGPSIDEAAIASAPPESLVSAGAEVARGVLISNDPRLGSPDATVTIVEFSDFQCPHCADFHNNIFPALRSLYGDRVRWYFVNRFYTTPHPQANGAAIAAECAHRQGRFWEYAEQLFRRQSELGPDLFEEIAGQVALDRAAFDACREDPAIVEEIRADQREASRLNVDATPTFIVNGRRILGAQPVGVFNEAIQPYLQ